jgi:hypothetical protein
VTHMLPRRTPLAVLLLLLPASILATTQTLSALRGATPAAPARFTNTTGASKRASRHLLELITIMGTADTVIEDDFATGNSREYAIVTAADGQVSFVSGAPPLTSKQLVNWLVRPMEPSERNPTYPSKYFQAWFERALPVPAQAADGTAQLPAAGEPIDLHGNNNVLFIRVGLIDEATGANVFHECDEACMSVRLVLLALC